MKEQIVAENQEPLTVVVRTQDDSMVFRVATLKELADKIAARPDIDPCRITIFRDRDKIKPQVAELCHRIEALSEMINPEVVASDIHRSIGGGLLADMVCDMRALSLVDATPRHE